MTGNVYLVKSQQPSIVSVPVSSLAFIPYQQQQQQQPVQQIMLMHNGGNNNVSNAGYDRNIPFISESNV